MTVQSQRKSKQPGGHVSGRWDDVERLLRPHMDEADKAAQAAQGREAWLKEVAANSGRYVPEINDAVTYFLNTVMTHRPEVYHGIIERARQGSIETVRGPAYARPMDGGRVRWKILINYQEWLDMPTGASFFVQTDGRWFFGYTEDMGDLNPSREVTEYGFDEHLQFVPSSFSMVEYGTVVTIVRLSLAALLHHYGLPLPS